VGDMLHIPGSTTVK